MAIMGERLPEAWMVEWHRNRRVEFPLRRWIFFLQVSVLPSLGPALLFATDLPRMLDSRWRFVACLLIVAYAGLAIVIGWQLVTQRPIVIVDHRGIHRGRRQFMAWSDIGSIGPVSGGGLVRQLSVHPRNVWAKNLVLTRHHVNDLEAFRTWLDEILTEYRRSDTSAERTWQ